MSGDDSDGEALAIAQRWCADRGDGWSVVAPLGRGGTAPVFELQSPEGPLAFKLYDQRYSDGRTGAVEERRIEQQRSIGIHDCPHMVRVHEGGRFDGRLYLVMNKAPGRELAKVLSDFPRHKIRHVLACVAKAVLFLRGMQLCHRDIKAANIYVTNDFSEVTLLDLSVTRGIYDPVGVGTDHDGQLPVVATARYSPPEYLFRLIAPGEELWHALDVYQLGCLLHDLIMRRELFADEFADSKENRYRFAWLVATRDPVVEAADVSPDLLVLARRALDKNWQRRSALRVEDFLNEREQVRSNTLRLVGIRTGTPLETATGDVNWQVALGRFLDIVGATKFGVAEKLRDQGVTAAHSFGDERTTSAKRTIFWDWSLPAVSDSAEAKVRYFAQLHLRSSPDGAEIDCVVGMKYAAPEERQSVDIELPPVPLATGAEGLLCQAIVVALADAVSSALNVTENGASEVL